MKLLGFLEEDSILLDVQAVTKEQVIRELVAVLEKNGRLIKKGKVVEDVTKSVLEREKIGSTGFGGGIAIPHVKASPHVKELTGAFGRSSTGVDFGAVDGQPVKLFFLVVSPIDGTAEHLAVLRKLAQLGRNDHFLRFLRNARDEKDVASIIEEMAEAVA